MPSSLQRVAQNTTHAFLDGSGPLPPSSHPHSCLQLFSVAPGEKGRGCPGSISPSLFGSTVLGLPKDPECGATALPPPRPSLCLHRRTAGSTPPRGGLGPSECAHREKARSR